MHNVTRRVFMKVAGVSAAALALSDHLLVSRAGAQTSAWDKEEAGYTFCDACNGTPFCGIKFYRTGDIVTRMEPWPGFPTETLCSKAYGTLQRIYHPRRLKYPMKRPNRRAPLTQVMSGSPGTRPTIRSWAT